MHQQYCILMERKELWKSKKILKRLYHNWYRIIKNALRPGSIWKLGGSGNLKEYPPDVISSDVVLYCGLTWDLMHTTSPFIMALSAISYSLIYCP